MTVYTGIDSVPSGFGPSAVTIGKFDGLHQGHRAVLAVLHERAVARGLVSTVITFDRHPLSLLAPEKCPHALVSVAQKTELLTDAGVDAVVVLAFDRALSSQAPDDFVETVLRRGLDARLVLVGRDFRYGARGAGNVDTLRAAGERIGFDVEVIDDVIDDGGVRTSSTAIRALLDAGRIEEATRLLGRAPAIRSVVVPGEQRGRELGYPTANLSPDMEGYLPVDGVYAVWASVDGVRYPGEISIGNNPTFDGVPARQAEVHLFDQRIDLYGRTMHVEFVEFVRPMMKFMSVGALIDQLERDDDEIRAILGIAPRPGAA
ncbi:MAG: bifunctional riboflavin kinase/FAD synthetase [Microbacteriaceae bacterium]